MDTHSVAKNICIAACSLVALILLNQMIYTCVALIVQKNYVVLLEERIVGEAATVEKSSTEIQKHSEKQMLFLLACFATLLLLLALFMPFPSLLKKGLCIQAAVYFSAHARTLSSLAPMVTVAVILQIGTTLTVLYTLYRHHRKKFYPKVQQQTTTNPTPSTSTPPTAPDPHVMISIILLVVCLIGTPVALQVVHATASKALIVLSSINKKAYVAPAAHDLYQGDIHDYKKNENKKKSLDLFIFMLWIVLMLSFVTFFSVPLLLHMGIWVEALFYVLLANLLQGYDNSALLIIPLVILLLFAGITMPKLRKKKA